MNVEFIMGATVTGIVIIAAIIMLVDEYRATRPRPDSRCPAAHPALQPRVSHLGGMNWACTCPRCHDTAVVTASGPTTARTKYSAHPCAAMPAPSTPPRK